jgi:hypothetical protein
MAVYKVTLGHAVSDENGNARGGKPGDQKQNTDNTKGECLFRDWYISGEKWDFVARCTDAYKRMLIAEDMIKAVKNPLIGYNQDHRYTLYDDVKKLDFDCDRVDKKVECDCSALVTVCANYAGIPIPRDTNTAAMKTTYSNTKLFKLYTSSDYTKSAEKLKVGDIIVRSGHHTAIVVNTMYHMTRELKKGMTGDDVKALQYRLNELKVADLVVDGDFGAKSEEAVKAFQKGISVEADGIMGGKTATALGFLWR